MTEPAARLTLVTPVLEDAAAFAPRLSEACAAGEVAAVLARFAPADERSLVNAIKALGPAVQDRGAALIVAVADEAVDLATIAARGGADGVHLAGDLARIRDIRERFKGERAIGVGGIRSRDDAMTFGEAGVDYLLFGEPRADGSLPPLQAVVERASWWAEIFETPCVAFAPTLETVRLLAATRAEFVALGDAIWDHPAGAAAAVRSALEDLAGAEAIH
jgi:thiamine-phosphate pyrophosphorylase